MSIDFERARHLMIEQQIRPWEVMDPRVLEVLASVHREDFVPARHRRLAFADTMLPLEHGEVMMTPAVEARLLQALELDGSEQVLEIGTGSGYLSACLARLARRVDSVERHADLLRRASDRLRAAGIANVRLAHGDALADWAPEGQYEVVALTGAVYTVPDRLRSWLKPGGRMFAIVGRAPAMEAQVLRAPQGDALAWHVESLFETDLPYLHGAEPPRRFVL